MLDLISLTWGAQVSLASGYAAYLICYRGIRAHHSSYDTIFIVLMFGLIASAELWISKDLHPVISGSLAFTLTIVFAVLWRRKGMIAVSALLRIDDTTWSDDTPSAWAKLQENREYPVSQLSVLLKNGSWYHCNNTSKFNDQPYSPCILGSDGDILMYLTSIEEPKTTEREQKTVVDPTYGARLTYVPKTEIAQVNIRLMTKVSRSQTEAALPLK